VRQAVATGLLALVMLAAAMGVASAAAPRPHPSIVNGNVATSPAAGSVAVVEYDNGSSGFSCTGTLIATNWVLTAGHCATDDVTGLALSPVGFRVGVGNVPYPSLQFLTVDQVVPNPSYSILGNDWDVALLHLSGSGSGAPTIDLLDPADASLGATGAAATAIGWGLTSGTGTVLPNQLYQTGMAIADGSTCSNYYSAGTFSAHQVCATANPGTTCEGDSGGPLLVFSPAGVPFIDGVTNYGDQYCTLGAPAGFAAALAVRDWVMSTAALSAPAVASVTPTLQESTASFAVTISNHGADSRVSMTHSLAGSGTAITPETIVSGVGDRAVGIRLTGLQAGTVYHGEVDVWSSYGPTAHPIVFRTVDHTAPAVQAFAARGRPGKIVRLKYRVADNSGDSHVSITVFRGTHAVLSRVYWLPGVSAMTWQQGFKVPRRHGTYRWCIRASDHDHNLSRQVCEPIKVRH
jgi:secreted trypsin-like serine protease